MVYIKDIDKIMSEIYYGYIDVNGNKHFNSDSDFVD